MSIPEDRPKGFLPASLAFILRHPLGVFSAMMALTALCGVLASRLPLVTDFAQLIPDDVRSVQEQQAGEPYLGNTSLLVVIVDARKPAAGGSPEERAKEIARVGEEARQAAGELAERLRRDPEFENVMFRFDRAFFEANGLLYLSVDQLEDLFGRLDRRITAEVLRANPLYVDLEDLEEDEDEPGAAEDDEPDIFDPRTLEELYRGDGHESVEFREYLVDASGTTYLILAQPKQPAVDMAYNRYILEHTHALADELDLHERFGVTVTLAGNYHSVLEENNAVRRDLGRAGLISLVLLVLLILFYFRRVRATWTIFVPLISGVVVMMGYVYLAVGRLNTITGFCFALFMGLSIDFAIHMLARYDEQRTQGASVFDALLTTYRETGTAAVAAALTSAAGFLSLTVADFDGLREFGIISGGGIIVCLLVIAIELPAVIALTLRFAREKSFVALDVNQILERRRSRRHGRFALFGLLAIIVLSHYAAGMAWEDDFRKLRDDNPETMRTRDRYNAILGRSTQPAVRITETLGESAALAQACNAERDRRGADSTVDMCVSLADFIPDEQPAKLAWIARIKELLTDERLEALDPEVRTKLLDLRERAPTAPLGEADLPPEIRRMFKSPDGDHYFMKAYASVEFWRVSNNARFADELMVQDDVSDTDIGPLGTAMIMADIMRVMARDSVRVVVVALASVFLVLLLIFRSLPRALACYVPLVAGLTSTAGLMVLMDLKLGFYNMIVLPSLIGLGVDGNIHLMHRYHVEGRGSWFYVVNTTGSACLMAAITTMAGFAGLLFAGHLGLKSIAKVAILGITTCTLVSLAVLPAVASALERFIPKTGFGMLPDHSFKPRTGHQSEPGE